MRVSLTFAGKTIPANPRFERKPAEITTISRRRFQGGERLRQTSPGAAAADIARTGKVFDYCRQPELRRGAGATDRHHLRNSASKAALASAASPKSFATYAPAFGLKWSQKFAASLFRSSSAVGSLQCFA